MIVPKYYEDINVLHKNTEPSRSYFIPAGTSEIYNWDTRFGSDRFLLLSGDWKFRYFDSIYDATDEFWQEGCCLCAFKDVKVPGVWQSYGADSHQYTNTRYPFPMDPPYVPHKNPCGEYVRTFEYHKNPKAPRAYINFEGVDSCFYLWLNGSFVGYSQVSHSTSEFDVTDVIRDGENTIAVLVLKWCDGSYFEDQDKFRMSGIFRDVYILSRPQEHIADLFIKAHPTADMKGGDIEVSLKYSGAMDDPTITLLGDGQRVIEKTSAKDGRALIHVNDARLWTAETPYLYTLVIEAGGEFITERVGIREIHATHGVLYINGTRVKFHGTNRHDSDPDTGFVVSPEQLLRDLRIMKEHNINAIRTSHYPSSPWAYQMYDEFGFYVIDETDNESHGTADTYNPDQDWQKRADRWGVPIANNPVYTEATVDRVRRCVERDKNRPSVVIWSMGNECGYGCTFEEALRWTKSCDDTRLTHYEGAFWHDKARNNDFSNLDTFSRMYPPIEEIHSYFKEDGTKPFVMCEFCHAMGNGPGDLEDYFEVIQQYDGFCGGFMWEWNDHAIHLGKTIGGREIYAYGGDHGEFPHDGNFCMDGLVYPDRTPHTGLIEFKNVYRPARVVSFDQGSGALTLHSYMDFVNLKDYLAVSYEVLLDGEAIGSGVIAQELLDIAPHSDGVVNIKFDIPSKGKCYLKLSYTLIAGLPLLAKGHPLGFDEVKVETSDNANQRALALLAQESEGTLSAKEEETLVVIEGSDFRYEYDKFTGVFAKMVKGGRPLLEHPMEYNIWRAPTDNDRNIKLTWMEAGYDRTIPRAYSTQVSSAKDKVTLKTELSISAIYLQRILNITAEWTVAPDGTVDVCLDVKKDPLFPFLPRFGLRMFLPESMERVSYCGIGPYESYIDKRRASWYGRFDTEVALLHEDYIRPQENGSHYGTDYVTICGGGQSLTAVSKDTLSFNASHYTQEELTAKNHNYELNASGHTVFCADLRHSGIGSNSCGPELSEKYRLDGEEFTFSLRLIPSID